MKRKTEFFDLAFLFFLHGKFKTAELCGLVVTLVALVLSLFLKRVNVSPEDVARIEAEGK